MICEVCRGGLMSIWQPESTRRLGHIKDFPELLYRHFPDIEGDDVDEILERRDLCEPEKYVFGHHPDYDSLVRSKAQGCVLCKEFGPMNDSDDVNPEFEAAGYYSVFMVDLPKASPPAMIVYSADDHMNPTITGSTSDAATWSLVQEWLSTCIHKHKSCRPTQAPPPRRTFAPTRLLELDTSSPERIFRLIDGASIMGTEEPYLTLSHCWGPGPATEKLRLLTSNEDLLRAGLPVRSSLPRLFRDAFKILERLGSRYLWIDRLCIVQDSAEDWEAEAATMQTVYQNGFLNIAALGARGDQDGCFFDRDVRLVAPTVVDMRPPPPSTDPDPDECSPLLSSSSASATSSWPWLCSWLFSWLWMWMRSLRSLRSSLSSSSAPSSAPASPPLLYRFAAEDESWRPTFENEPLLGRAWVLQERILAVRNLYFGSQQVFWECGEANRCETIPRKRDLVEPSMPPRVSRTKDGEPGRQRTWKALIDPGTSMRRSLGWNGVVQHYSGCSLTFPTDKLVALSGLAKDMRNRLEEEAGDGGGGSGDAYLAGMWRNMMPSSLLWRPARQRKRPSAYRAPSWSWASVDGDIEFGVESSVTGKASWDVRVIGAQTISHGKDATGELVGGHVILSAPLCIAKGIIEIHRTTRPHDKKLHQIQSFHHPDTGKDFKFDCDTTTLQFDTQDHYENVAVVVFTSGFNKPWSYVEVSGLAVVPVAKIDSCFRRVGWVLFHVKTPDGNHDFIKDVLNKLPVKSIELV